MIIRAAEEGDIPSIVTLLKLSLGEGLMPKSEAYWNWKHVENPFGSSPVLLAEEGGKLIGVRAFMRWEWTDGKQVLRAVRAVDTATHPDFQGKGVFKKLTMGLVDSCKTEGLDFVFNTPNAQSRPGYLKMGWQDVGRMPVRFFIVNPMRRLISGSIKPTPASLWFKENNLPISLINSNQQGRGLNTRYTEAYFYWRYLAVPVTEYYVLQDSNNIIFYRFKRNRWGMELRVTDWLTNGQETTKMKVLLLKLASGVAARLITFSGLLQSASGGFLLHQGPRVTIRNLAVDKFDSLQKFKNWSPSLGDMELF